MKFAHIYFFLTVFILCSNLYSQENPLIAEITGLTDHQLVSADLDIYGTATGDSYQLYISNSITSNDWTSFASGTNVENGYLGTLEINGYESGRYAIKLIAETGGFYVDTSLYIVIDHGISEVKSGFPIQMQKEDILTFWPKFMLVDDLDYDGNKEIIATNGNDGKLHIYKHDGSEYISPIQLPQEGSWIIAEPCVADFNRDGSKEIVVLSYYYGAANISIYSSNGLMMSGWPKTIENYYGNSSSAILTVADVNGDEELDIISAVNQDGIGIVNVYNKDGYQLIGWPFTFGEKYIFKGPPAIADLDNDGKNEVILAAFHEVDPNNNTHYVIAVDYKGEEITGFRHPLESWAQVTPGGDINADGYIEFVGTNGPINRNGDSMEWNFFGQNINSIAMANINAGDELELFFGYYGNYCLTDYKGNLLPGWPVTKYNYNAWGDNIIADVNGDGSQDFIVEWEANYGNDPKYRAGLNIYDINGNYLEGFPKYEWAYHFSHFSYEDMDGDGRGELICMISDSSQIYSLDLGYPFNPDDRDWIASGHDNQSINNYHAQPQNVLVFSQDDMQVDEDDSLTFRFAPAYLDWQTNIVSVSADTSVISFTVAGEMLTIRPDADWNGESEITISVNNGQEEQSSSFKLIVNPMSDSPKAFLLDIPENNISLKIDSTNINDSLVFKWRKALDPDNDLLHYSINFSDSLSFLNKVGIIDSFYAIPYKTLSDFMTDNDILDLSTEWTVTTYDNEFSVPTSSGSFNVGFEKVTTTQWDYSTTEFESAEDDTLVVTINSILIDWGHCILTASSDTNSITISIQDSNIVIIPDTDWNGTANVTFDIYSGLIKAQEQFAVTVNPVQDAPQLFALTAPLDSTVIIIDTLSVKSMLEFSWENAIDPDDDILHYAFSIVGLPSEFNKDSLSSPACSLSLNDVASYLSDINNTSREVSWSVIAFDQFDTTKSVDYALSFRKETVDNLDYVFTDTNIDEDDSLVITITSDIINWEQFYSVASSDTADVDVKTNDSVIVITPEPDWNGQAVISYYIYSGMTESNRSFLLDVVPVNDPPQAFNLLTPSDSAEVIIDNSTIEDSLTFSWEYAVDIDSDNLLYSVVFADSLGFMNKDSIQSNSYKFPIRALSDYLTEKGIENTVLEWSVYCNDMHETVEAANNPLALKIVRTIATSVEENFLPDEIFLSQNYPNPFNPASKIEFGLTKESDVSLNVYNMLGQLVAVIINSKLDAGYHYAVFDGSNLASGIYIYRLEADNKVFTKKMILVK